MSKKKDSSVKKDLPDSKDSSVKKDRPNSKDSSVKKDRPNSSQVYFYDEIPRIAICRSCTVLIPEPNILFKKKNFFKKKKAEQPLHSFGYCTILLLEYGSDEDVVNFTACENQTPAITVNLNRIIDKSLEHIVKDSKVWQEFHVNDHGKKRSFVLQFEKGQEFDEFFKKLGEVLSVLHACKDGKLSVVKKYYLVGFKDDPKVLITEISTRAYFDSENRQRFPSDSREEDPKEDITDSSYSSDSSENSTSNPIDNSSAIDPPFFPKAFNTIQTRNTLPISRVDGLDKELTAGLHKRPKSERNQRDRYHDQIYGSLIKPLSRSSLLKTLPDESLTSTVRVKTEGNETIKSSNTEQSSINRRKNSSGDDDIDQAYSKHSNDSDLNYSVNITELDKNRTIRHDINYCHSVNITEIDSNIDLNQTVNITQLDFDNIKLKKETCHQAHSKHSDDSDLNYSVNITEIDLDKNGTVKHRDFCQSVIITEIDSNYDFRKTVDITQIDFDIIKSIGETDNLRDVLIGDEATDTTMKARQEQNQLKQYAQLLQAAINDGDQENARQYADILAASHLKIAITVDENSLKVETNSQDIKIKVSIEDKECQGGSLLLSVKLTDTIGDLKAKMFFKHKFPIEVQKWIVGKRIPKDEESLQKLRVTNGQTVYLYLVSARSVGLDKQQHMATSGYIDMSVSDTGMPQMVPAVPHHVPQQPMNQLSSTPTKVPVRVDTPIQGAPVEPPPRGAIFNPITQADLEVPIEEPPRRQEPDGSQIANTNRQDADSKQQIGWHCRQCTYLNLPTRPGCEMCSDPRPKDYKIPENYKMSKEEVERIKREEEDERKAQQLEKERQRREAEQSQQNFQQLLRTDDQHLVPNRESFDCPICFDRINPGRGVVLRECLHSFCRDCLKGAIVHSEEAFLRCPFNDGSYSCNASLQDREIKALVPEEIYERFLQKSLSTAESQEMNSFHCKTPDCQGWCIYEDHVNFFKCPVCNKENCLTCKAIHEGVNCKKYQDDLHAQANNNAAARRTRQMLNDMVKEGEAMHCPQCKVILQKKDGCDWLKCSICKTEICWVTKGPRWGSNGPGDISGGCRCRVNGEACHPDCNNCH